jgi:lipopolysaccharide export system protein LptC
MMVMAAIESDDTSSIEPRTRSREAEFHSAQHHSRRVRLLKVVLPSIGAAMALGFFGYSYISTPVKLSMDVASSAISNGKLVMSNPKLEGFTKENLSYSMTASRALQKLDSTRTIELENMKAKLPIGAKNWATVDALKGVYDSEKNTLDVTSNISVTTTDGMAAKLKSAFIDLGKGDLKTGDAVEISLKGTKIAADSMTVLENGKVLVFEKRVRMQISPDHFKTAQEPSGDTNAAN